MHIRLIGLLISIIVLIPGCHPLHEKKTMQAGNNKEFITKLQDSIESETDVCAMDKAVGIESLINTCRDTDRLALKHTDFGPDSDDKVSFNYLNEAKDIVYWKVDHPSIAKIIGVYWPKEGSAKIFQAIIYPP